jgi:hypothetical protein
VFGDVHGTNPSCQGDIWAIPDGDVPAVHADLRGPSRALLALDRCTPRCLRSGRSAAVWPAPRRRADYRTKRLRDQVQPAHLSRVIGGPELKGTPYKWLDLRALSHILLPGATLGMIRYFTGPVRQDAYLRALRTLPEVIIHLGLFKSRPTRMPLAHPQPGGPATVEVIKTEEKGSDVNLATYLLLDAFRGDCDVSVVISNDSDLVEPIRVVRHDLAKPVGVINPHPAHKRSWELLAIGPTFYKQIRPAGVRRAQFAPVLNDSQGTIHRPSGW